MKDKEKEIPIWNPPEPPWSSEPSPLQLNDQQKEELVKEASKESGDAMPLVDPPNIYNGKPVGEGLTEDIDGTELDGFFFYRIKSPTGITLNGKHFQAGGYWFNQETYEGIEEIDAPFRKIKTVCHLEML